MLRISKELSKASDPHCAHGDLGTLLQGLLIEVVSANDRYFLHQHLKESRSGLDEAQLWCWPPLMSNERQVSGLFANALSTVCPISSPELPITRTEPKNKTDSAQGSAVSHGRNDFFATYGERSVALELKRIPIGIAPREWSGLANLWRDVGLQAQQALGHMRRSKTDYPFPAGIGLMVIRVSRKVRDAPDPARADDFHLTEESRFDRLVKHLSDSMAPDFLASYLAPREMRLSAGWDDDEEALRIFPGIVFAASVYAGPASRKGR